MAVHPSGSGRFVTARKTAAQGGTCFGAHVGAIFFVVVSGVCHKDGENADDDLNSEGNADQHDDDLVVSGSN